jgi:aminoglycoside 2'-N-acetyltransferase I
MTFRIETIHEEDLTEERRDQLIQWFRDEFGYIPLKWADPEWYVLALNGQELIGRLAIIDRIVLVEGQQIHVGGVSGVVTKKEWRKRGVGGALMVEAVNVIEDKLHTPFGLLLCREEVSGFYKGMGWKVNDFSTRFEQPSGKMTFPRLTMTYSCKGTVWPKSPIDLNGLPW